MRSYHSAPASTLIKGDYEARVHVEGNSPGNTGPEPSAFRPSLTSQG